MKIYQNPIVGIMCLDADEIATGGLIFSSADSWAGFQQRINHAMGVKQTVDQKRSYQGKSRGMDAFLCIGEEILKKEGKRVEKRG